MTRLRTYARSAKPGEPGKPRKRVQIAYVRATPLPRLSPFDMARAAAMSEEELDAEALKLMKLLGIPLTFHDRDARGNAAGWLDRVYGGPGGVLFRELKRGSKAVTTAEQIAWMACLRSGDLDADYWDPYDLLSGRILRELQAIARPRRKPPTAPAVPIPPAYLREGS